MKIERTIWLLALCAVLSGCHFYRPIRFEVVDADTGAPVPHAYVSVSYADFLNPFHPKDRGGMTDETGSVVLPAKMWRSTKCGVHAPARSWLRASPRGTRKKPELWLSPGDHVEIVAPDHYRFFVKRHPKMQARVRFALPEDFGGIIAVQEHVFPAGPVEVAGPLGGVVLSFQVAGNGEVFVDTATAQLREHDFSFARSDGELLLWHMDYSHSGRKWGVWTMNALASAEGLYSWLFRIEESRQSYRGQGVQLFFVGELATGRKVFRRLYHRDPASRGVREDDRSRVRDNDAEREFLEFKFDSEALGSIIAEQSAHVLGRE